jgi:hypothetical protein
MLKKEIGCRIDVDAAGIEGANTLYVTRLIWFAQVTSYSYFAADE